MHLDSYTFRQLQLRNGRDKRSKRLAAHVEDGILIFEIVLLMPSQCDSVCRFGWREKSVENNLGCSPESPRLINKRGSLATASDLELPIFRLC